METISEVRLGLTKPLIRLAYYYLTRGFGQHVIDHAIYDTVEIKPLCEWQSNPEQQGEEEFGGGIRVTFYRQGQKVRFVEFAVRYGGGGGEPSIFLQPR
jgi:hypothetical protein